MRSPTILASLSSVVLLGLLPLTAQAQQPGPGAPPGWGPAPTPGPAPAPVAPAPSGPAPGAPGAAPGMAPAPMAPRGPAPAPAPGGPSAGFHFGGAIDTGTNLRAAPPEPSSPQAEQAARDESLKEQNTIGGATGLLHMQSASSGAAGTFRVNFLLDWFSASNFLCNGATPCPGATANDATTDSMTHFGATMGLSVTATDFLEAYGAVRSYANSNDRGRPELLQVLGDTTLGLKAFTPNKLGQTLNFGGSAELLLLNGTGGVGLQGNGTSGRIKGLMTADLREPNDQGLPARFHLNLGYHLDNSGNLVKDVEARRGNRPITRIERFGLGINRTDQFEIGLGAEGMFEMVRPFVEYNVAVPVNRQGYSCNPGNTFAGDECLGNKNSFSYVPSTVTIGARAYPALKGFEVLAAFDIGVTGTSNFLEEVAPTPKWDLWLGLGYAFDTVERAPVVQVKQVEKVVSLAPPQRFVRGFVHEKDKAEGVPDAIVRYEGRELTAMATGTDGRFTSQTLEPGTYTFAVHADGFKDGQCQVTVPATQGAAPMGAPPASGPAMGPAPMGPGAPMGAAPMGPGAPMGGPGMPPAAGMPPQSNAPSYFEVDCPLEALPRTGNLFGKVLDAEGNSGVASAKVEVTDAQGKHLEITTDAGGGFRFEGVTPGTVTIKIEADGYMMHVQTADVRPREDQRVEAIVHKRPKQGLVEIGANEIRIKQQIHFETDSAKIQGDSTGLLEEIADVMVRNPRLKRIEIQGHTDNSGTADHNKTLSEQRASAVREWLIAHGVEPSRLVAKGYGQERPVAPNVTAAGKARNRRVQFIIVEQDGAAAGGKKGGAAGGGGGGGTTNLPKPKPAPLPF